MKKKAIIILSILLGVFAIVAISGWGFVIYQNNEIKNRDDKIAELTEKIELLNKKVDDLSEVDDPYADYIKVDNWDVMFPYTNGVSKVKVEVGNEGDGSILVKNIVKDEKTYDVNLCGGDAQYKDEAFYLGKVIRWKNEGSHKEGAENPTEHPDKYALVYRTNKYTYYYRVNNNEGCKTGVDNAGYEEGVEIARDILYGIRVKEQ